MDRGMGAVLLEAIWTAELSLLLRSGEYSASGGAVAGECAHFFLASVSAADFSDLVLRRPGRGSAHRTPFHRRHLVHVRREPPAAHSPAESFSRGDAAFVAVRSRAPGIRPA